MIWPWILGSLLLAAGIVVLGLSIRAARLPGRVAAPAPLQRPVAPPTRSAPASRAPRTQTVFLQATAPIAQPTIPPSPATTGPATSTAGAADVRARVPEQAAHKPTAETAPRSAVLLPASGLAKMSVVDGVVFKRFQRAVLERDPGFAELPPARIWHGARLALESARAHGDHGADPGFAAFDPLLRANTATDGWEVSYPFVDGLQFVDLMQCGLGLSPRLAVRLAVGTLQAVETLERLHLAHCDICPDNLFATVPGVELHDLTPSQGLARLEVGPAQVCAIDFDTVFNPAFGFDRVPSTFSLQPGREHYWRFDEPAHGRHADRFPTAVVVTELLVLGIPERDELLNRQDAWAGAAGLRRESLFNQDDWEAPTRIDRALELLGASYGAAFEALGALLAEAYRADSPAQCPPVGALQSAASPLLLEVGAT